MNGPRGHIKPKKGITIIHPYNPATYTVTFSVSYSVTFLVTY